MKLTLQEKMNSRFTTNSLTYFMNTSGHYKRKLQGTPDNKAVSVTEAEYRTMKEGYYLEKSEN
jgi:hypothetical protein